MHMKTKLPIDISGISELMDMNSEEVYAWPHFKEVREAFKDYNLGVLNKERLINKLYDISAKCATEELYHYSTGIDSAVSAIRIMF